MKIRTCFVSNSSSSSFVCDVSGTALAGYDGEYGENVCEADCGHSFLEEYLLPEPEGDVVKTTETKRQELMDLFRYSDKTKAKLVETANPKIIDEIYEENEEDVEEMLSESDEVSSARCPLCQFTEINTEDLSAYLMRKYVKSDDVAPILEEIKKDFGNYPAFKKYIKGQ